MIACFYLSVFIVFKDHLPAVQPLFYLYFFSPSERTWCGLKAAFTSGRDLKKW